MMIKWSVVLGSNPLYCPLSHECGNTVAVHVCAKVISVRQSLNEYQVMKMHCLVQFSASLVLKPIVGAIIIGRVSASG